MPLIPMNELMSIPAYGDVPKCLQHEGHPDLQISAMNVRIETELVNMTKAWRTQHPKFFTKASSLSQLCQTWANDSHTDKGESYVISVKEHVYYILHV